MPPSPGDIIFNEYVADNISGNDFFELLVIANNADLRGLRVSDNELLGNGTLNNGESVFVFGNDSFLSSVPRGTTIADAGDTITDFKVGTDKIVLTQLFQSFNQGNLNYSNAFSGGFLTFGTQGSNTVVRFDSDGTAGRGLPTSVVTVQNIAATTLNNSNNFVI